MKEKYTLTCLYELDNTPKWISLLHVHGVLVDNFNGTFTWQGKETLKIGDLIIREGNLVYFQRV